MKQSDMRFLHRGVERKLGRGIRFAGVIKMGIESYPQNIQKTNAKSI